MSTARHRLTALAALLTGGIAGFALPVPAPDEAPARSRRAAARSASDARAAVVDEIAATPPAERSPEWAEQWARKDPHAFLSWLLKCEPQPAASLVEAFFAQWILANPDAAFTAAADLPSRFGYGRENPFFVKQLGKLFGKNPEAAFRWVGRVEGIIGGGALDPLPPQDLSALNPDKIAQILRRTPPGEACTALTQAFSAFLTTQDRGLAKRWAESLPSAHANAALGPVLRDWFTQDRTEVMDYLANAPSSIRQGLGRKWAGRLEHPEEGFEWTRKNMGYVSFQGFENDLRHYAWKNRAAATAYVLQLPASQVRVAALRGLSESVTMVNQTSAAIDWIDTLPDEAKLTAFSRCMEYRISDFAAFFNYLKEHATDGIAADYAAMLGSYADYRRSDMGGSDRTVPLSLKHIEQLLDWAAANPGPVSDRLVTSVFTALGPGAYNAPKVPDLLERLPEAQRALAESVTGKR